VAAAQRAAHWQAGQNLLQSASIGQLYLHFTFGLRLVSVGYQRSTNHAFTPR
jgi:hypothetical protein|tara:strand:- start:324 stop:479 length:156 start_codon:yes stop_codon:yes gene_type:complete